MNYRKLDQFVSHIHTAVPKASLLIKLVIQMRACFDDLSDLLSTFYLHLPIC